MRKTDKKMDKALVKVLTEVCEIALKDYDGFEWITHFAHYDNFPESLSVVCIFDTNDQLKKTNASEIVMLINEKLLSIGIKLNDVRRHVDFDTEENCTNENNGHWNARFK
jgi:hypothetical protein